MKTDKCEDKRGESKSYSKVIALSMQILDKKPERVPVNAIEKEMAEYEA